MSETSELAQEVNAAARLRVVSIEAEYGKVMVERVGGRTSGRRRLRARCRAGRSC
jgi:hypothetical protein